MLSITGLQQHETLNGYQKLKELAPLLRGTRNMKDVSTISGSSLLGICASGVTKASNRSTAL